MEANLTELNESKRLEIQSTNVIPEVEVNAQNLNENTNPIMLSNGDAHSTITEMEASGVNMEILENSTVSNTTPTEKLCQQASPTNGGVEEMEPSKEYYETICNNNASDTACQTFSIWNESNYFKRDVLEVGRYLWKSDHLQQHYTKGCLWSPDGTCLLVPVHADGMHIIELPFDLYNVEFIDEKRPLTQLTSAVHIPEGTTVYDCVWYPLMNSLEPSTCCWLSTCQHEPIHMWDAFTGNLCCSYSGYNDVDEVEAAIALHFSHDGEKILAGYKKSIKIFDTNIPGRQSSSFAVKHSVACFATTADSNCVTTGSWNAGIYHYDLRNPKLGPLFVLNKHKGGITWLRYICKDGNNWHLFSGARRDNTICEWDMRNYTEPIRIYQRNVRTNQRIYFDISTEQQWLISGDTNGLVHAWNLQNQQYEFELQIHSDCCNGVNMHPSLPILATSSGQYHFINNDISLEKDQITIDYENSLVLLWLGALE